MDRATIKYRYALDDRSKAVDIFNLTGEDRKDYVCLGCEQTLRPVLPKKSNRQRHFRHKTVGNCSFETYLHRMGVRLFQETYSYCLAYKQPFFLTTPIDHVCQSCPDGPCTKAQSRSKVDLTKVYTNSIEEVPDQIRKDWFKPDVLLTNDSNEKIYVEIVVSHKSSDKKIESKTPIIEITLIDEDNFSIIQGKDISCDSHFIELINFETQTKEVDFSDTCENLKEKIWIDEIHKESKRVIFDAYQSCPCFNFNIERKVKCNACEIGPCEVDTEIYEEDLKRYFPRIFKKQSDDGFQLLFASNSNSQKVYFEIKKTFSLSKNYFNRINRGEKIIEYDIDSKFDLLDLNGENANKLKTTLYNFNPKPRVGDFHKLCIKPLYCFTVLNSGKVRIKKMAPHKFKNLIEHPNQYILVREVNGNSPQIFIQETEKAFIDGYKVKNCYLCRYHSGAKNDYYDESVDNKAIFCRFLKVKCGSNQAANCEYYRPDKKVFGTDRYPPRKWY